MFAAVLLLLVYAAVELLAYVAYAVSYWELFSFAAVEERRRRAAREATGLEVGGDAEDGQGRKRVIHPYLGFIRQPMGGPAGTCTVNSHGFFGAEDFARQAPDRITVVITGGSVARNLYCANRATLGKHIGKVPGFGGKRINWIGLAYGGFRQPQQLMALSYLLVLGVRVDMVVALDGFNEVSGVDEWSFYGAHPVYPEDWSRLVYPVYRLSQRHRIARIERHRASRRSVNALLEPLSFSVTAGLVRSLLDDALSAAIRKDNLVLQADEDPRKRRLFYRDGPLFKDRDPAYMPRLWYRSSLSMAALARQHGFKLFFFTQPSQYVVGSKVLTGEEKRIGVLNRQTQAPRINRGYRELRRLGAGLRGRGVWYHDLSLVFRQVKESVYADDLCHMNWDGREIVARTMGQKILEDLAPRPSLAPAAAPSPGDKN